MKYSTTWRCFQRNLSIIIRCKHFWQKCYCFFFWCGCLWTCHSNFI